MTEQDTHKTLDGGSIDYAHYIRKGHEIRSAEFGTRFRAAFGWLRIAIRFMRPAPATRPETTTPQVAPTHPTPAKRPVAAKRPALPKHQATPAFPLVMASRG